MSVGSKIYELRPCGSLVLRVLIQSCSRPAKAAGSQCSRGTILWSLFKSWDLREKWRYRGICSFLVEA